MGRQRAVGIGIGPGPFSPQKLFPQAAGQGLVYWKGRMIQREMKKKIPSSGFLRGQITMGGAGPGQSQESRTPSWSSTCMAGLKSLGHTLLPSQVYV